MTRIPLSLTLRCAPLRASKGQPHTLPQRNASRLAKALAPQHEGSKDAR
jgi:hypothetical protein